MMKEQKFDVIICGGGIKGILTAVILRKAGYKVCLLELSTSLGGVLNSIPWKGYSLDIGCHLFDNSIKELTELFFEIHDGFKPVDVRYSAIMEDGQVSQNMAQPDLTAVNNYSESQAVTALKAVSSKECFRVKPNYEDYLKDRFSEYIATFLEPCVLKKTGTKASLLCFQSAPTISFDRVKVFESELTKELKKNSFYDERLALANIHNYKEFSSKEMGTSSFRNFYPEADGMGSFCRSVEDYLMEIGVEVMYETSVMKLENNRVVTKSGGELFTDKIIWSSDLSTLQVLLFEEKSLSDFLHSVAAVLIYFEVPAASVSDITYLHDYRLNTPSFRISTSGLYSGQINDGNSFICAEVFTSMGSELWEVSETNYDKVWTQVVELGLVDCHEPLDVKVMKTPSAYKLPLAGYSQESKSFLLKLKATFENIVTFDELAFSKVDIYKKANKILKEMNVGQ